MKNYLFDFLKKKLNLIKAKILEWHFMLFLKFKIKKSLKKELFKKKFKYSQNISNIKKTFFVIKFY